MDYRRVHSASLEEAKSRSPSSSTSSLPSLWKSLKAKLRRGADKGDAGCAPMASTNSSSDLASPGSSPPTSHPHPVVTHGAFVRCSSSALEVLHATKATNRAQQQQQRLPPLASGLQPKRCSSTVASQPSPVASPTGVNSGSSIFSDSNGGTPTSDGTSGPLTRLPSTLSPAQRTSSVVSTTQSAVTLRQAQGVSGAPVSGEVREVPAPVSSKVLAVSPALPAAMKRQVWSLEDYVISKKLYTGASSAVYRATCRRSGLPVALKVYFLSRVPSNVLHMLKREIQIHTQMVHKHILRLYGAFMDSDDRVVLVQEFAANGDLFGVLQRLGGRMHPDQVAENVLRPFLEALSFLHSRGVCHRDIKPENILFTQSWRLVLADFGVSINLSQERAVTRAGTEGYMAPEVERCPIKSEPEENKDQPHLAYSTAVDIYATGILAYELMVGIPPAIKPPGATPCGLSPSISGFVDSEMGTAGLHFPASVPPLARSFISVALSPDPAERPTAAQLLTHPWLRVCAEARRATEADACVASEAEPAAAAVGVPVASRPQPSRSGAAVTAASMVELRGAPQQLVTALSVV